MILTWMNVFCQASTKYANKKEYCRVGACSYQKKRWFAMKLAERKRNRLKYWDYSRNGMYFITICVEQKKKLLSNIVGQEQPPLLKGGGPRLAVGGFIVLYF
jgi:hypothetical protein